MLKLIVISSLLFLVACGTKDLDINVTPMDRPELTLQSPDPIILENVTWIVISKDGKSYMALSAKDFEALTINFGKLQQFIVQQGSIIEAYEKYYKSNLTKVKETEGFFDSLF